MPQCVSDGTLYLRSLNWAIMLVTGMDYVPTLGPAPPFCHVDWQKRTRFWLEAVEAQQCHAELDNQEVGVITGVMLFTAMMWTLVTAKFVDVVTNTDPDEHEFKQNLDDLNNFMEKRECEKTCVGESTICNRRLS